MTDFDLKVDSETGQLYAEDPETGDRQPVPFDEIDVNNAGVESLNTEYTESGKHEVTTHLFGDAIYVPGSKIGADSGDKSTLTVGGLERDKFDAFLVLIKSIGADDTEPIELVLDGDDDNGNYNYWFIGEDNPEQNEDVCTLVETNDSIADTSARVLLIPTARDDRVSIIPKVGSGSGAWDRIDNIILTGGYGVSISSTFDLEIRGRAQAGNEVRVYGVGGSGN